LTNKTRHKTDTRICEINVSLKVNKSITNCLLGNICHWKTCTSPVTYLLKDSTCCLWCVWSSMHTCTFSTISFIDWKKHSWTNDYIDISSVTIEHAWWYMFGK